jgi:hypothetical protein
MSSVFYDHILHLEHLSAYFASLDIYKEEKEELWHLIDEMLHHRILTAILDKLPGDHHENFLSKFTENPADHGLISYLNELVGEDIETHIVQEIALFENEIGELIKLV